MERPAIAVETEAIAVGELFRCVLREYRDVFDVQPDFIAPT
jgi:hypothetical protein